MAARFLFCNGPGPDWVNASVVQDANLVTARRPDDLDAFCNALRGTLASASGASV